MCVIWILVIITRTVESTILKYNLKVHIVIVTKYRKKILKDSIAEDVKQYIEDIATEKGYEILAMKTDKDHIHFLIGYDCTDW